ncbi:MAG: alpha/beta hydrolase [Methanomicrobiaceae archaeon]|nr:alpha/beta hydrolase [Methanomicrobiaceae archaeon]
MPLTRGRLLIRGDTSFLLVGKACKQFTLFIEAPGGEYCQSVRPDDLVAVSSPEGGPREPARMLLALVRDYHLPLVVLPKGHPGSGRLKLIVAVADEILLACDIQRGTHPDQHLLCSSGELAGIRLCGVEGGVGIGRLPPGAVIEYDETDEARSTKNNSY